MLRKILLSAALAAQVNNPAIAEDNVIQVGTYNLELFGSNRRNYGGMPRGPRSDDQIRQIADRITSQLDLEIIAFQEINTTSQEWNKLKSYLRESGYQFVEGNTSDRNQFVVLAWDADEVQVVAGSEEQLNVRDNFDFPNCHETGLRKPIAARFKAGEFDFWVVAVHLKSRSGEEPCNTAIRTEQCKDIIKEVNRLRNESGEGDFLLVGDFNEDHRHRSFSPLKLAGFTSQSQFLSSQSAKGSYVKNADLSESTELIDQLWLNYGETKEVIRRSTTVWKIASNDEARRFIREQSDHVPVWVSFGVTDDLDDE